MVHLGSVILCPVKLRRLAFSERESTSRIVQWLSNQAAAAGFRSQPHGFWLWLLGYSLTFLGLDFLLLDQLHVKPCRSVLKSLLVLHFSTFPGVSCRRTRWISSSTGFTPKLSGRGRRCLGETWFQGSLGSLISYFAFIKHDFANCARDGCLPAFLRLLTTGRQRT